jgi:hypothetical protein
MDFDFLPAVPKNYSGDIILDPVHRSNVFRELYAALLQY